MRTFELNIDSQSCVAIDDAYYTVFIENTGIDFIIFVSQVF